MALDITKLENVIHQQGKIIAKCPACAELDQDKKGNHLFIDTNDRFGCIVYPGKPGKEHRSRIFVLVGIKTTDRTIVVSNSCNKQSNIIISDVLGRLGRQKFSPFGKPETKETTLLTDSQMDSKKDVPSVPGRDTDYLFELFIERASIKEFEAGLPREEAEKQAFTEVINNEK